jgi:hypothetical protein
MDDNGLPLPARRCLSKEQAAEYLGIGPTLLVELGVPCIKLGRRSVYDQVDLDAWLEETKQRGRAGKETRWPVNVVSTEGQIPGAGGLMQPSRTASEYAKALGLKAKKKPSPC